MRITDYYRNGSSVRQSTGETVKAEIVKDVKPIVVEEEPKIIKEIIEDSTEEQVEEVVEKKQYSYNKNNNSLKKKY